MKESRRRRTGRIVDAGKYNFENTLASARLYVKRLAWIFAMHRPEPMGLAHWCATNIRYTLCRMGRHKTISNEEVLRVARDLFRAQGHTATTRAIAEAAGISEAILYQRFGSKDELFLEAMRPRGPDIEELLGPLDPPDDAHAYVRTAVMRIGKYFAEVIPLALRVLTHPGFAPESRRKAQSSGPDLLQQGLAERLTSLSRRHLIDTPSEAVTARLLVSLAHDWALRSVLAIGPTAHRERELKELVDAAWDGLRARGSK